MVASPLRPGSASILATVQASASPVCGFPATLAQSGSGPASFRRFGAAPGRFLAPVPDPCFAAFLPYPDGFAKNQRPGSLVPRGGQNIAQGLAGDTHGLGGLILVHTFQVGQAQCFNLIPPENHGIQAASRHPGRHEQSNIRFKSNLALFQWARHRLSPLLAYANNINSGFPLSNRFPLAGIRL